jgi:hypothetical protein
VVLDPARNIRFVACPSIWSAAARTLAARDIDIGVDLACLSTDAPEYTGIGTPQVGNGIRRRSHHALMALQARGASSGTPDYRASRDQSIWFVGTMGTGYVPPTPRLAEGESPLFPVAAVEKVRVVVISTSAMSAPFQE